MDSIMGSARFWGSMCGGARWTMGGVIKIDVGGVYDESDVGDDDWIERERVEGYHNNMKPIPSCTVPPPV